MTVGDTYTEPGATAIDDVDVMIQVVISGSWISTVGTITYTSTDSSGNSVVTRTVQVVAGQTTGSQDGIYFGQCN